MKEIIKLGPAEAELIIKIREEEGKVVVNLCFDPIQAIALAGAIVKLATAIKART